MINKKKKHLDVFNKLVYRDRVQYLRHKDRLESLRVKYETEIRAKEEELVVLKAKLANVIELAREADEGKASNGKPDYSNTGPTEAIIHAVSYIWKHRLACKEGVQSYQIKNHMLSHGFRPRGQQFHIAVSVTLRRLADSNRLLRTQVKGENYYRPAEDFKGTGAEQENASH